MSKLADRLILAIAIALALLDCAILWHIYLVGVITLISGLGFIAVYLLVPYFIGAFIYQEFIYPFDGYQGGFMLWLLVAVVAVAIFTILMMIL